MQCATSERSFLYPVLSSVSTATVANPMTAKGYTALTVGGARSPLHGIEIEI
jgi:hypothetical protein